MLPQKMFEKSMLSEIDSAALECSSTPRQNKIILDIFIRKIVYFTLICTHKSQSLLITNHC